MNSVTTAADKDLQWKDSLTTESSLVRRLLIAAAFLYLTLFLFVPIVTIFTEALKHGISGYFDSFLNEDALAAIRLTLLVAAVAVPLNAVFGVAAAWAIAKFEFLGKQALITLIDMPLAVSPVISGLIYGELVFLFMYRVFIPLSAIGHVRYNLATYLTGPIGHPLLIGLPIALCVRRFSRIA